MNKLFAIVVGVLLAGNVVASGDSGGFELSSNNDVANISSLQRGARNYVNYCLGCHSLRYVRYNRVAADLDISEAELADSLMWTAEKSFSTIEIAMPPADSARWFGRTPPDLSLISRSRGVDWLYTYLKSFYVDENAAFGYNNLKLEGLSMPHALWELEGDKAAIFEEVVDAEGNRHEQFAGFEQISSGSLTEHEYDRFVLDLVNFLDYAGEPVQIKRQSLGIRVIAYLLVFLLLAMALKKEFWKDIH